MKTRYPISDLWLTHSYKTTSTRLTALNSTDTVKLQLDGGTTFVAYELFATCANAGSVGAVPAGPFTAVIRKNAQAYMNAAVRSEALWGTTPVIGGIKTFLPMRLKTPMIINPSVEFNIDLVNLFAGANQVTLTFRGIRVYDKAQAAKLGRVRGDGKLNQYATEPYWYVMDQIVGASARQQANVQILEGGDYVTQALMGFSTGRYQVRFSDSGKAQSNWDDSLTDDSTVVGSAQYPNWLHPRVIKSGATLTADLVNTSVAGNTIQIALLGYHRQSA